MNILFVSAVLPYPLFSGGQVRIYNLLKRLSKNHSITLFSFIRKDSERAFVRHLDFLSHVEIVKRGRALQPNYVLHAFGKYPLLLASYDNIIMRSRIEEAIQKKTYDLIHIEPFYVYPSLPYTNLPLVVGEHNIEYEVYRAYSEVYPVPIVQYFMKKDVAKMRRWEELCWTRASKVVAVSQHDADCISKHSKQRSEIVSNGVDTDFFRYVKHAYDGSHPTLLFVGNFTWLPNKQAVTRLLKTLWPAIIRKFPNAHLTIVGKQFPQQCMTYITPHITLKQDVNDIRVEYAACDILLAPMGIAGGSKYKILEAMASGTLVVTTKFGYMGLECSPNIHVLEADTENSFVDAIKSVYAHPEKANILTSNARKLIEATYDWDIISKKLDSIWRNAS